MEEADHQELERGLPREAWPKGVKGSLQDDGDDGFGARPQEPGFGAKPAAVNEAATYAVELTKTPLGLGITLTGDLVTEIKPDSQAARDGRIKVSDRA
jgi:hypothetical protein